LSPSGRGPRCISRPFSPGPGRPAFANGGFIMRGCRIPISRRPGLPGCHGTFAFAPNKLATSCIPAACKCLIASIR
jgi:hypothetical protein